MKTKTKIIIGSSVTSAAVAAMSAVSYTITDSLIKLAFNRELRHAPSVRAKEMVSGCKNLKNIDKICSKNEWRLKNCNTQRIELTGCNNTKLVGHLYRAKDPKRIIVAMHGWRSSWSRDFGAISEFWQKNNCTVLYPDQRAQNDSEGEYISFGITERFDCVDWIKWINENENPNRLPIYLCGISMGATTVLMASGEELPENVAGIIADCGYTSPQDIFKHVMGKNLHIPYTSLRAAMVNRICVKRMGISPDEYSTTDALKKCRIPVLFFHGSDDHFVPIDMTYKNYNACRAEKRLYVVPYADHGMSYFIDRHGYEDEIKRFWSENDSR